MAEDRASSLTGGSVGTALAPGPEGSGSSLERPPVRDASSAAIGLPSILDSSASLPSGPLDDTGDPARARLVQRSLEVVPGLVSWALIVSPLVLSFRFPEVVAWFVLSFDFYWLYKAVLLTGSVCVTFARIRRTMAEDWRTRALALADPVGRLAEIERLVPLVQARIDELERAGQRLAVVGGRRELGRLDRERRELARILARRGEPLPDPRRLFHVALVPDVHRAVREAVRDGPRPGRGRLPAATGS